EDSLHDLTPLRAEDAVARVKDDVTLAVWRCSKQVEQWFLRGFDLIDVIAVAVHHQHRHGDVRREVELIDFGRLFGRGGQAAVGKHANLEARLDGGAGAARTRRPTCAREV